MLGIFQQTAIPALEHAATFSQKRHELLAGNIANLDTPGYRTRDLDLGEFQNALAESIIQSRDEAPGAITATTREDHFHGPRKASEQVVYHDGSDVSLESQITEIAKNTHMHSLAITTMRSQFALLQAAITERA